MATAAKKAPAKKPAAKKKAPVPASESAPKYQVIDEMFVWIGDGSADPVRIPLRFKTKLLRAVSQLDEDGEPGLKQLFALLDGLGDTHTAEQLDEQFWEETEELVEAYFDEFEQKHSATVGES